MTTIEIKTNDSIVELEISTWEKHGLSRTYFKDTRRFSNAQLVWDNIAGDFIKSRNQINNPSIRAKVAQHMQK